MAAVEQSGVRRVEEFEWPSPEVNECPFPFYAALREQAPVYRYPGRDEYIVSRWDDIAYVSEHPEIFRLGRIPGSTDEMDVGEPLTRGPMSATNPPEHARKRHVERGKSSWSGAGDAKTHRATGQSDASPAAHPIAGHKTSPARWSMLPRSRPLRLGPLPSFSYDCLLASGRISNGHCVFRCRPNSYTIKSCRSGFALT